jgi:hypothetical protein
VEGLIMKRILLLAALLTSSCGGEPREKAKAPAPAAPDASLPAQAPVSRAASVVPLPKDQAQLDRMILAGYTPHGNHLHPPGVNECPLTKGNEAVM